MIKTRILIADDSPLIRQVLVDILSEEADFEIIGQARDGAEAVELARQLRPDVITMDVEMPRKSGLEALREIMAFSHIPVLMISTKTSSASSTTIAALETGAYDFVCKPSNSEPKTLKLLSVEVVSKVRASRTVKIFKARTASVVAKAPTRLSEKVVLIAASTGGPRALTTLFESFPKGLDVPMLIVQHIPEGFTASIAARLTSLGTVPVKEAKPGARLEKGVALLAPGGAHMRVAANGELTFDEGPKVHGVRPAADHMFLSAASAFGSKCVGVVLTGMGKDGAAGALSIRQAGGIVFGESEETCAIYGMPKVAKEIGGVDAEFPIHQMGQAIVAALKGEKKNVA